MGIYKRGDTYIKVSGKSPRGFKGVLFVTLEGTDPTDVREGLVGNLDELEEVDPEDLSDGWRVAFGLPIKVVQPIQPPLRPLSEVTDGIHPDPLKPYERRVRFKELEKYTITKAALPGVLIVMAFWTILSVMLTWLL